MNNLKIISFNVNGLRSVIKDANNGGGGGGGGKLSTFLSQLPNSPNIVCIQETKIGSPSSLDLDMAAPEGWIAYYAFHRPLEMLDPARARLGYSGVATFIKKGIIPVISYEDGFIGNSHSSIGSPIIDDDHIDDDDITLDHANAEAPNIITLKHLNAEARVLITDHLSFVIFNCYFPNDQTPTLKRRLFREKFHKYLFKRASSITNRRVIILGDINVTYQMEDHYKWINADISNFLEADSIRTFINDLILKGEYKDAFREKNSQSHQYTCWDQRMNLRPSNQGSRIDIFFLRGDFTILSCEHLIHYYGSDHCPIYLELLNVDYHHHGSILQVEDASTKGIRKQKRIDHFFQRKSIL